MLTGIVTVSMSLFGATTTWAPAERKYEVVALTRSSLTLRRLVTCIEERGHLAHRHCGGDSTHQLAPPRAPSCDGLARRYLGIVDVLSVLGVARRRDCPEECLQPLESLSVEPQSESEGERVRGRGALLTDPA